MSNAVETFKQPFLDTVEGVLDKAVSITWDGCHKIYVTLDEVSHNQLIEYEYEMVSVKGKDEALAQLHDWWEVSCGLRFIQGVEGEKTFHDVIPQFAYDEEEEEEEEEDWEEEELS